MIVYSLILFAVAALLIVLGVLVYRGNTGLIHAYHQTRVKDKAAYGRALGKALCVLCVPLVLAGIVGLFTASLAPTLILILGLIPSCIPLIRAQKTHNGGIF